VDAAHLGAGGAPEPLLGEALGAAVGLPGLSALREAERQSFAQLARVPWLTLLHRQAEGAEPVSASPLLMRWQLAAARVGRLLPEAADPREPRSVPLRPTPRPRPVAPALVPERYSASRYEALRSCPYRFYAGSMLGLGEAGELDDELEKSEVGTWLHAVLYRFHEERSAAGEGPCADLARLQGVAADEAGRRFGSGPASADFLPFEQWFEAIAPAYVNWLHRVEAEGWSMQGGEVELRAALPPSLGPDGGPIVIDGRLDRVDHRSVGPGPSGGALEPGEHLRLIDYKLKARAALQAQVRVPFEDTQVAFYAALLGAARGWPQGGIEAGYLALDGRDDLAWVAHKEVAESAQALLEGLSNDVTRLRAGAPLPALGEGAACDYCTARGLCRRDHWGPA
jgi:ATP-dependent helicase/nuclease subunit B